MRLSLLLLLGVVFPVAAQPCAVCMGAAGDPMTNGANMAILSMLLLLILVLMGFAVFFVYLARRNRQVSAH